jgi:molybdopterin converting factor small subunit
MNKLLLIAALAVAGYLALAPAPGTSDGTGSAAQAGVSAYAGEGNDAAIDHAIANRSKQQLEGKGTVERLLADDNHGSRHQRFIVRLDSGRTLLVAHNIDLAPRIDSLHAGDTVAFFGEYEWNPKGGVIHWTHRDPQGRHVAGWIRHGGRIYQ